MAAATGDKGKAWLLEASRIVKRFGGLTANDDVTLQGGAGRNPRLPGRERCRQVDAGQDDLRRAAAQCGRTALEGRTRHHRQSRGGPRARHRHGVPALLPVRGADRRRKHRPGPGRPLRLARAVGKDRPRVARIRPAAGALRRGGRSFGGRAPAHRDRALPVAGTAAPDHGRADRGADAAGGGPAFRHPASASPARAARCSTFATAWRR